MPTDQSLEGRVQTKGPSSFPKLVPKFDKAYLLQQIQHDRLTNEELRHQWLYGGDGVGVGLKGDDVILYLTDFDNNPFTKNPKEAGRLSRLLLKQGNFFIYDQDASDFEAKAESSSGIAAFNLSSPDFQRHLKVHPGVSGVEVEHSYIEVPTAKLAEGRDAFRQEYGEKIAALFDRVHGNAAYGANGIGALLLGEEQPKNTTRIYLPDAEYARKELESKAKGTIIARISYIDNFDGLSNAHLFHRYPDGEYGMRGLAKETAMRQRAMAK